MKLYLKSLKLHFKSMLEYKMSFIISFFSQIIIFFSFYFVILSLFDQFDNIKGFTLYEVLLCFSVIQFGYSICEVFARGIDRFDRLIINGDFDRVLVRPQNIILQVLCSDADFVKVCRVIQALIIMVISLVNLNINWTIYRVICLLLMMISSIAIFFGIFLLAASYCFITVQGLEVRNVFTDGGKHMAQYPIGVFKKGFVLFFTFIIPYAFVNYYPLLYFIGKSNNILYAFSPLIVFVYLVPCFIVFHQGTKRYASVGS
ncbi:MAG: ABC-2 family transporter protein [Bacilli bacterium]|nr:ABC-2 family transporter protein [Bacilli bacterium]